MIIKNEVQTVKNLQNMLELTDIVVLYDVNFRVTRWAGFVKDLPLQYLHSKIVDMFMQNINIVHTSFMTVYIV